MKDWAVLIFMAGDNNLAVAAETNLRELLLVGSSDRVDVVVQVDSQDQGTIRYHVEPGDLLQIGEPVPETNTGDPRVLSEFLRWARKAYPARQTLLVVWGHGTGWADVPDDFDWNRVRGGRQDDLLRRAFFTTTIRRLQTETKTARTRAVALDASSRDFLDNDELRCALFDGLEGKKLDLLGFDGCLMASIEVAYHLRDQCQILVGSQEVELPLGWPYAAVLKRLTPQPEMTPRDVSAMIVEAYGRSATGERRAAKFTQSAVATDRFATTFRLMQDLSSLLIAGYPDDLLLRRAVHEASGRTNGMHAKRFRDRDNVDLVDWLKLVQALNRGDPALRTAIDALLAHLTVGKPDALIVATAAAGGDDLDRINGLSIYLPDAAVVSSLYDNLEFAQSGWGTFVRRFSEQKR
jgi:hypothetical protein